MAIGNQISGKTQIVGVIGWPVSHSIRPQMHNAAFREMGLDWCYIPLPVDIAKPDAISNAVRGLAALGLAGANVTVPHKIAVMKHLDRIDDAAKALGAVNTIWREGDKLAGGNTDWIGFLGNLDELTPGWDAKPGKAVILGAGGAARAAAFGLRSRGYSVALANRTVEKAEDIAAQLGGMSGHSLEAVPDLMAEADLLVNTTSLGMLGKPPLEIDVASLKHDAIVYDIIYAPLETSLLKAAKAKGHRTVDGLGMLLHQAVDGFRHWFGEKPHVTQELREMLVADIRAKTPGA